MIVLFSWFGFAQDTTTLVQGLDMSRVYGNQINKVVMRFCNNGFESDKLSNKLVLSMRPGEKEKICVAFVNQSNTSVTIQSSIFSAQLNENRNYLCSNKDTLTWDLFISDFSQLWEDVTLDPQWQFISYFTIASDNLASWNYYGCFTYNLNVKEKLATWSPFELLIRKAANMQITVEWSPYYFQWFDDALLFVKNEASWVSKGSISVSLLILILLVLKIIFSKKNKKSKKKPVSKINKKQVRNSKVHHKKK